MALSRTADVVIVGGGVVGTSLAYYLAKMGVKATLLERTDICSGSSGACDTAVSMQSKNPGIALELALESRKMYGSLATELGSELDFEECGGMIGVENEMQLATMQDFVKRQQENGLDVVLLSGDEARRRQPAFSPNLLASTYSPMDAKVNPLKVTFGFARAARALGATICCGTEVLAIGVRNGRVESVTTKDGIINTNTVVNAAGVWSPFVAEMVGVTIPIKPRRGQLIVTEPIPGYAAGDTWSARYIVAKHNPELIRLEDPAAASLGVGLSVTKTAEGNLLIGGTRELAGYDTGTTPEALTAILRHAVKLLPGLKHAHIIRSFAGLRPYTPDGKPILGPVDGIQGFLMAAGHEGDGIALAPVTGSMMSEYIATEKMAKGIRELSLSRFASQ